MPRVYATFRLIPNIWFQIFDSKYLIPCLGRIYGPNVFMGRTYPGKCFSLYTYISSIYIHLNTCIRSNCVLYIVMYINPHTHIPIYIYIYIYTPHIPTYIHGHPYVSKCIHTSQIQQTVQNDSPNDYENDSDKL